MKPGRKRFKPRSGPRARDIERTCVKVARGLAYELEKPFVGLFTGPEAERARRCVYKRVMRRRRDAAPAEVSSAINAVLLPGEP